MSTEETIKMTKSALQKASTYDIGDGLHRYNLEEPAKHLYPVDTPVRNMLPRARGVGDATRWRAITGIASGQLLNWVGEGERAPELSVTVEEKTAAYRTIGTDTSVTFEAQNAAQNFDDLKAKAVLQALQSTMIKEERFIIGGNASVALGTPTAPTVTTAASGGSIGAGTYNVIVVALTYEGFYNSSVASGVKQSVTTTLPGGATTTQSAGSSNKSTATATSALTGSANVISASTPVVPGAVAYAWYVGTATNETLQAITTINSIKLTALTTTNQNATAITADHSRNATKAFDGLLYAAWVSGSGAYVFNMATGTAGTGTGLTANGMGGIDEIDAMLVQMYDDNQVSPDVIFVSTQERKNISTKMGLSSGGTYPLTGQNYGPNQRPEFIGNAVATGYLNHYTTSDNQVIPIKLHPYLPKGTMVAWANNLPAQFQTTNTPSVAEVDARADYYQIDYPLTSRVHQMGVYSEEVLKIYAPFAIGVITNIADA